jgi:DNA-binding NarL/FixJ family response regulator
MPLRLVLADDAALIRQALAELLQRAGVEVVAQAGNAPSLVRAVEDNQPDVAIIDIRMPPTQTREGIHAALEIRELFPAVGTLLLSTHTQIDDVVELFSATASRVGYLLKDSVSDLDELIDALTRISEGGTVLDPKLVVELLAARRRTDPLDVLTPREREVLAADGPRAIERRDRKHPLDNPRRGRKAHQARLRQAQNPRHLRHPPTRPRRHHLPRNPLTCAWPAR